MTETKFSRFLIGSVLISGVWNVPTSSPRPYNGVIPTVDEVQTPGSSWSDWNSWGIWGGNLTQDYFTSKKLTPRCSSMPALPGSTQPQRYGFSVCNSRGIRGHHFVIKTVSLVYRNKHNENLPGPLVQSEIFFLEDGERVWLILLSLTQPASVNPHSGTVVHIYINIYIEERNVFYLLSKPTFLQPKSPNTSPGIWSLETNLNAKLKFN